MLDSDTVDPRLLHKQALILWVPGAVCVWLLNPQCGGFPGDYPGTLPLRIYVDSVLVGFLTNDDGVQGTEAGLVLWTGVSGTTFLSTLKKKRYPTEMALVYCPCTREHPGNKDWISGVLSTSNKYLGYRLKTNWTEVTTSNSHLCQTMNFTPRRMPSLLWRASVTDWSILAVWKDGFGSSFLPAAVRLDNQHC